MANTRFKNVNWSLPLGENGSLQTWQAVEIAVLMDIRDELQELNGLLRCPKFLAIPSKLEQIRRNTTRKPRPRKP